MADAFGAVGALGNIAGGIIGHSASQGERNAANDTRQAALDAIMRIQAPTIEEQMIHLQQLKEAGQLTPEMEQALELAPSEVSQISTDPRLRQAQMQALSQLQQLGNSGLDVSDRAAMAQIQNSVARQAQGQNQAILQNMAARGMGGSGAELAAQLANSQNGAVNAQSQGNQIAQMAQARALQAMQQAGSLGGQLRTQDFGENQARAQAADAINRFNTQNRQGIGNENVGLRNQAQASNLANKQRVMDTNVGLQNQQEIHNKGLYQQNFEDELQKAMGAQGAFGGVEAGHDANAARTAQMWNGIGQGFNDFVQSMKPKTSMNDSGGGGGQ